MSIGPEASPEEIKKFLNLIKEKREPLETGVLKNIQPMTFTLNPLQVKQMDDFINKHNRSRKCSINKRRREHKKKGIMLCGGECQYSLEITFASFANLASIKCECGEEKYLGEV